MFFKFAMSGNVHDIATWRNFHQNAMLGIIHHDAKSRNNRHIVESSLTFVALVVTCINATIYFKRFKGLYRA